MRDACDIDKLRDLVHRQHDAKRRHYKPESFSEHMGEPLGGVEAERQVTTYIAQGTTVAALTKCVEAVEAEAKERVKGQREAAERREDKLRARRVVRSALSLIKDAKLCDGDYYSRWNRKQDKDAFIRDCKKVEEWIGDPWDD